MKFSQHHQNTMDTYLRQGIRVALADPIEMSRTGLKVWLQQAPDINVIAETGSSAELLEIALERLPDVLVLNYSIPFRTTSEILHALRKEGIGSKIVVVGDGHSDNTSKIISAGADAFLHQDEKREVVIAAVRHAARNSKTCWLSPSATKRQQERAQELSKLGCTPMEKKILGVIDNDNSTIAAMFNLAAGTVRNHISNIYLRLNVPGRKEAIQTAIRLGLLSD